MERFFLFTPKPQILCTLTPHPHNTTPSELQKKSSIKGSLCGPLALDGERGWSSYESLYIKRWNAIRHCHSTVSPQLRGNMIIIVVFFSLELGSTVENHEAGSTVLDGCCFDRKSKVQFLPWVSLCSWGLLRWEKRDYLPVCLAWSTHKKATIKILKTLPKVILPNYQKVHMDLRERTQRVLLGTHRKAEGIQQPGEVSPSLVMDLKWYYWIPQLPLWSGHSKSCKDGLGNNAG